LKFACDVNIPVGLREVAWPLAVFVAAFAAAMLPACTQSCDALSRGEQFQWWVEPAELNRMPVPSDKLDEDTAAAISAVSQGSTGTLRIKMHNKLAALVVLGKYLGMFDERPQNSNAHYAISDTPMTKDEWIRRYVTPH
jgi:hypothetical protein